MHTRCHIVLQLQINSPKLKIELLFWNVYQLETFNEEDRDKITKRIWYGTPYIRVLFFSKYSILFKVSSVIVMFGLFKSVLEFNAVYL